MSKELHRLGYEAFSGCTSLKLTIPDSVLRIGEKAFKDLPNVNYNGNAEGSPWWAKAINGVKSETKDGYIEVELNDEIFRQLGYEVERLGEDKEYLEDKEVILCKNKEKVEHLDIPATYEYEGKKYKITSIGEMACLHCESLKSVNIFQ